MKKRLFCVILALILLFSAFSIRISRYYSIACDSYAEEGLKGTITKEINETLALKLNDSEISYDSFAKISYADGGRISSISIDTAKINLLAVELANEIYNCIYEAENKFGIPFGNLLGDEFASGSGPDIKVTIVPVGSVSFKINSELLSGGINQSLHRINITFESVINCLTPFHEKKITINTTITLAETLIVGEIPNVVLSS